MSEPVCTSGRAQPKRSRLVEVDDCGEAVAQKIDQQARAGCCRGRVDKASSLASYTVEEQVARSDECADASQWRSSLVGVDVVILSSPCVAVRSIWAESRASSLPEMCSTPSQEE